MLVGKVNVLCDVWYMGSVMYGCMDVRPDRYVVVWVYDWCVNVWLYTCMVLGRG